MAKRNYNYRKGNNNRGRSNSTGNSFDGTSGGYSNKKFNSRGTTSKTSLLVQNTSNFNWTVPTGTPVSSIYSQPSSSAVWKDESFPVLMTFKVQPTIGISKNLDSPAHRLALTLYNDIVKINSTNAPYDPVDIEKFVLAASSLSSFIEFVKRIYRIAGTYTAMNRSVPQTLIRACGIDGSDIRKHMSNFRKEINLLIRSASVLNVPDNLPFFNEWDQLYANVYVDEESPKAQMYMFVPDVFYKYDELGDPLDPTGYSGARLLPMPIFYRRNPMILERGHYISQFNPSGTGATAEWIPATGGLTTDELLSIGWEMVENLLNSQDVYRLQADIAKTYGEGSMRKYTELEADEVLSAVYDPTMLRQIENLRISGRAYQYTNTEATHTLGDQVGPYFPIFSEIPGINKGYLTFTYYPNLYYGNDNISAATKNLIDKAIDESSIQILNSHKEIPSPEAAFDLTRFVPTYAKEMIPLDLGSSLDWFGVDSCGLSLITECQVWSRYWDDNAVGSTYVSYPWYIIPAQSDTTANVVRKFASFDKFDWHPMVQYIRYEDSYSVRDILFDIDIFAEVPSKNIKDTHEVRIIDAFNAPGSMYSLT